MKNGLSIWRGLAMAICLVAASGQASAQLPVSDGLLLWLDATDPSTLFEDLDMSNLAAPGDEISLWADKSGNDFHASTEALDGTEYPQPIHEADGIAGNASVRFSGADGDGLSINEDLFLERDYTVFIANQYHGTTRGRTLQGLDSNWLTGLWAGQIGHYADGWVGRQVAFVNEPYVVDAVGDEGFSTFTANGVDLTTSDLPIGNPGRLGLVSVGQFGGEVSDADVSEVIIYDRVLSDAELASTRSFLYDKYNASELPEAPPVDVIAGDVRTFTGGDPGEGLDFEGDFLYALNVGGPEGAVVGDAEFEDASIEFIENDGVFITEANQLPEWHLAGEYGDSSNDNELESVMQSIRWNVPPGVDVELEVEAGQAYQLQLLFAESCCVRGFDIFLEGEMVVDNLNVGVVQGGINNGEQGVVYSHTFTAGDNLLNILLGGEDFNSPDNNPILNALTLERVTSIPGDFDGNGMLDAADIDALSAAIATGEHDIAFDLDGDNLVQESDRFVWVQDLKNTYFGDANLDGEFNSADFVFVFRTGQYEDGIAGNSTWSSGDWNGDGDFDSSDFVIAFTGGGFENGPRAGVASVPEPASSGLLLIGLVSMLRLRSRRR